VSEESPQALENVLDHARRMSMQSHVMGVTTLGDIQRVFVPAVEVACTNRARRDLAVALGFTRIDDIDVPDDCAKLDARTRYVARQGLFFCCQVKLSLVQPLAAVECNLALRAFDARTYGPVCIVCTLLF
jgi:hypothetical protein